MTLQPKSLAICGRGWKATKVLPFFAVQRQRCIKFRVLRAQDFYAYNLIRWATFGLQKVKKQKIKTKARKGKDEKEDNTVKREKAPHLVWFFFLLSGSFLL